MSEPFHFSCAGVLASIRCDVPDIMTLLRANFHAMAASPGEPDVEYRVITTDDGGILGERRGASEPFLVANGGELILALESDFVVQVQTHVPQLLFLHAAALEKQGACHLLTGRSGAGKSTTCWAMVASGYGYLSDEMAPIALNRLQVLPYPHALCLKSAPPPEYPLPAETLLTARGHHVPTAAMASVHAEGEWPLGMIFFVEYVPELGATRFNEVPAAEAATRLYPNVLNALAHGNAGLEAVATVAAACRAWQVQFSSLADALQRLDSCIESAGRTGAGEG